MVLLAAAMVHADPPSPDRPDPREAELRARIDRDPSDTGALCELGFLRFRQGRAVEAAPMLDTAIAALGIELGFLRSGQGSAVEAAPTLDATIPALGAPAAEPLRRRLAACLYNRGRVAEAMGDVPTARSVYERSLALRPNDTVRARLAGLPPPTTAPDQAPSERVQRAALALCEAHADECEIPPDAAPRPVTTGECSDATRGSLVEVVGNAEQDVRHVIVAVASRGEDVRAAVVNGYWEGSTMPSHHEHPSLRTLAPGRCGLVVEAGHAWVEASIEGAGDFNENALVVLWWTERGLARVAIPTSVDDGARAYELDVALDGAGGVRVRRVAGRVPDVHRPLLGTHTLEALADGDTAPRF